MEKMDPTCTLELILTVAARAGINVTRCSEDEGNLYCWVTPEDTALYIGKAASKRRYREETKWKDADYHDDGVYSGLVMLLQENDGECVYLKYSPEDFDPKKFPGIVKQWDWSGGSKKLAEEIEAGYVPSAEEVEKILIRIPIRLGKLIGNSQFASQWETPIGTKSDWFAYLGVNALRDEEYLKPIRSKQLEKLEQETKEVSGHEEDPNVSSAEATE